MIRTSTHIINEANENKLCYLKALIKDYREAVIECSNLIMDGKLPLQRYLSKTDQVFGNIKHATWKQLVYKGASEILRKCYEKNQRIRYKRYKKVYSYFKSKNRMTKFTEKTYSELNLKRKYYAKPLFNNIPINIDSRLIDIKKGKSFDMFLRIKLPYMYKKKTKEFAVQICVPVKNHKHSLKFREWKRSSTIRLQEVNKNIYVTFSYEKEAPHLKSTGEAVGIDIGYNKLLSLSDGRTLGQDIKGVYKRIIHKKQGSKNSRGLIIHKNNLVKKALNQINFENYKEIFIENLSGLKESKLCKKNKKTSKYFRKISNYIPYSGIRFLIKQKCEEHGVRLVEVPPQYTSQMCSRCGTTQKSNRKGEKYFCSSCGLEIDADINAAINIYNKGVCNPLNAEKG